MAAQLAGALEIQLFAELARLQSDMSQAVGIVTSATKNIEAAAALATKALGALGIGASLGGLVAFIEKGIDAQAMLYKLSIQTGLSVEMLSALKGVAKAAGTDLDTVSTMINKLEKNMLSFAQNGGGKAGAAFAQLGYSQQQVKEGLKDLDAFLPEFAKRLVETGVGGEQAGLAMQLIGRGGATALLFLQQLAEQGALVSKVTTEQAKAAHEFEVSLAKLKTGSGQLAISFANELLPSLQKIADEMLRAKKNGEGFFGVIAAGIKTGLTGDDQFKAEKDLFELVDQRLALERKIAETKELEAKGVPSFGGASAADWQKQLDAVDAKIQTTRSYLEQLRKEAEKPAIRSPNVPLPDAIDPATIKAQAELQATLSRLTLQSVRESYAEQAQLADAFHKAGLISDQDYFHQRQTLLDLELDAEVVAIAKQVSEEQALREKARAGGVLTAAENLNFTKKLIELEAARDTAIRKSIATRNLLGLQERAANLATLKIYQDMAVALAELNKIQDQARSVTQGYADANRQTISDLQFEIELIGKSAAEQEKLTALRKVDLEMRQALAALPRDEAGEILPGAIEEMNKIIAAAGLTKEALAKLIDTKTQKSQMQQFADDTGAMWRKAGTDIEEALTKAFGAAGQSIGAFVKAYADGRGQQADIDKKYRALQDVDGQLSVVNARRYADETLQNTVTMYAGMFGAASQFFDKQSEAYKILSGIEKAMYLLRFALQAEAMVKDLLFTSASVASSGARASADGTAAIAKTLASVPFPYNLAAGAVVLAALAGLGIAISGGLNSGGGGQSAAEIQKTQSTGTVLGDSSAKSSSLLDALKAIEGIDSIGLNYTRDMADSLRAIESSMSALATLIYRTTGVTTGGNFGVQTGVLSRNRGDPVFNALGLPNFGSSLPIIGQFIGALQGLWGKTTQSITDSGLLVVGAIRQLAAGQGISQYANVHTDSSSFFGLVHSTSDNIVTGPLAQQVAAQFGLIFQSITQTVEDAVKLLGLWSPQLHDYLMSLPLDLKLSLDGLKGQELSDALNAFFSGIADQLATAALPTISTASGVGNFDATEFFNTFQKSGEGAFQTLIRVASEFDVVSHTLAALGTPLDGVSMGTLKFSDTLVTLMGGVDKFQQTMASYMTHYYSPTEQHAITGAALNTEFTSMGFTMPTDPAGFRHLVEGIDRTTEAGANLYARMMKIEGTFYDFSTQIVGLDGKLHTTAETLQQHAELQDRLDLATGAKTQQQIDREHAYAGAIDQTSVNLLNSIYVQEDYNAGLAKAHDRRRAEMALESQLADAQGNSAQALAIQRSLDIEGMDAAAIASYDYQQALKSQIDAQNKLNEAIKTADTTRKDLDTQLFNLTHDANAQLVRTRELRMADLTLQEQAAHLAAGTLTAIQAQIDAETDRQAAIKKVTDAADAAGLSLGTLSASILNALQGGKNGQNFGDTVAQGIKTALQKGASDQIAQIFYNDLITPLLQQIIAGGAVADVITQANIDDMVARAQKIADGLATVLDDPRFKTAMDTLRESLNKLGDSLGYAGAQTQGLLDASGNPISGTGAGQGNGHWVWVGGNWVWVHDSAPGSTGGGVDTSAQILDQKLQMQAELYKLTGNAAGAAAVLEQQHAIALAKLDPSLRQLQTDLWAAQAAADAAAKALEFANAKTDLQIQLLRAQGNEAGAVALEHQKIIDELNAKWDQGSTQAQELIALYQQLWSVQGQSATATAGWIKQMQDWLRALTLDQTLSPLTARQRFDFAQSTYVDDLMKAQGGDADARARFTNDADAYLKEALSMFGRASGSYEAIYTAIVAQTNGLIAQGLGPSVPATLSDVQSSIMDAGQTAKQQMDTLIAKVSDLNTELTAVKQELQANTATVQQQTGEIVEATESAVSTTTSTLLNSSGGGLLAAR
jgi:hypothetical protein